MIFSYPVSSKYNYKILQHSHELHSLCFNNGILVEKTITGAAGGNAYFHRRKQNYTEETSCESKRTKGIMWSYATCPQKEDKTIAVIVF